MAVTYPHLVHLSQNQGVWITEMRIYVQDVCAILSSFVTLYQFIHFPLIIYYERQLCMSFFSV